MTDSFKLYVPIEKIDTEKRTVAGWATSESIDKQSEIVDYNGSKEAFSNWAGNIREMHEPKAVGKAIEIIPHDDEKRVWVKAYISKGSEDTWSKVKEGILTGFSIGGQTVHKTTQVVKDVDAPNSNKVITRIMKYRLNELSLVDNPANPECSFELVKNVDGVPFQTEVVEDMKKVVVTEALDPLKSEVNEHRDKADSLIKKVLDKDELENLDDDHFGIVRKYEKGSTIVKERLLPMPDKVHAVRALQVLENYNLTDKEIDHVHNVAKHVLGAAYDTYKNLNRGGEDNMSKESTDKILNAIAELNKRLESVEKAFEGAYRPVAGSKEHPNQKSNDKPDPNLGESAPIQSGAADDVETQPEEGKVPYDEKEPQKAVKPSDTKKAKNPAESDLETQESPAAPVKKDGKDSEGSKYPGKHPATVEPKTQPEEGAYPAKGPVKAEAVMEEETADNEEEEEEAAEKTVAAKSADAGKSENDLSKVQTEVESLRKRFDEVLDLLKQPKPRKIKIEKNFDDSANSEEESQLQKDYAKVMELVKSGKELTPEQESFRKSVLDKMLTKKFA